jgi:transcriptional regulator with XRE-family HTH domain
MEGCNIVGFDKCLQQLRKQTLRLTQEEFSELTGISRSYIAAMEKGIRSPSIRVFYILRKRCGMSVDLVLDSITPDSLPLE